MITEKPVCVTGASGFIAAHVVKELLGNKLIYLFSYFQPKGTGSYLRSHIGRTIRFDHSKIKKELGIKFISFEQSINETIQNLIHWGHLEKK